MIEVVFNNEKKYRITGGEILRVAAVAAKHCRKIKGVVEITLIDNQLMRKLNKEWRGMDKTTDVLSYAWGEDKKMASDFLGQIFISYPRIKIQAREYGVSLKEELFRMIVHGLLHLIGFDHIKKQDEKKMFVLQDKILKQIV